MPDILTNKTYRDYRKISRYTPIPYYYNTVDNKYMYGTALNLNKDCPYKIHTVEINETLDSIAVYYYNNPTYYWIVADFNGIHDPFARIDVGTKLKIPTFSRIEFTERY